EDSKDLFCWRNDEETRKASISQEPVSWEDHCRWYEKSLASPDRDFYVGYAQKLKIGVVRRDRYKDGYMLSWNMNPEMRGRNAGKILVKLMCDQTKEPCYAEIKPWNIGSIKIAEHAGMRQIEAH